ncbi:MAG: hypothetical protein ABEI52_02430, partial [Halobacteriaceae archaeon]
MTLNDWIHESIERYRTLSPRQATQESLNAFRMGAQRRIGTYLGTSIWERGEWDVLVVLDACRLDTWRYTVAEYDIPTGDAVWSNASCSIDWIRRNLNASPDHLSTLGY